MIDDSTVETRRLQLRPVQSSDARSIQQAASDPEIADAMISIPHPFPLAEAKRYVARRQAEKKAGCSVTFVVENTQERAFVGLVEIRDIDIEHSQGELSFWLAVDAWGQGYMSEVVEAVVDYGFERLGLNRLYAYHMLRNPASGHVLRKNGFTQEGVLRQRVRKQDQFEDVALWSMLQHDRRA